MKIEKKTVAIIGAGQSGKILANSTWNKFDF